MSIFIVAAILVGTLAAICLLLIFVDRNQKRKQVKERIYRLTELGTEYNLVLSSQELFNDGIIGLDGINRKLLVLKESPAGHTNQVVDLNEVKSCSLKKSYGAIYAGNGKSEQYLEAIALQFDFDAEKQPVEIPFYRHIYNPVDQLAEREQRASYWETILSKMLKPRIKTA